MAANPSLTLFVDVGGVLLNFDKQIAFDALAGLSSRPAPEVERLLADASLEKDFEIGALEPNAFANKLRTVLGTSATNDSLEQAWSRIFTRNGDVPSRIASMCSSNEVPVELFSDTDPWRAGEIEALLKNEFPEKTVARIYSFNEKSLKCDGESLRRAKARIGSRNEAILLDDVEANVRAAVHAGLQGVLFDGENALKLVGRILASDAGALRPDELARIARAITLGAQIKAIIETVLISGTDRAQTRIDRVFTDCGFTCHFRPLLEGDHGYRINQKAIHVLESVLSALDKEFSGRPQVALSNKQAVRVGDESIRRLRGRASELLADHYRESLSGNPDVIFFGNPAAPLIARAHWLPESLVPIREIDDLLDWVDSHKPAMPLFPLFQVRRERMLELYKDEREVNHRARDDVTYRLVDVGQERGLPKLVFAESSYAPYIDTCEALLHEVASAYTSLKVPTTHDVLKRCKWRTGIKDVFDLTNRDACAGINTLCILADPEADRWLLHKRYGTMEAAGMLHVLPAGTFQPFMEGDQDHRVEFSLHANVFREFCEEVLCKEKEMLELRRNGSSAITMREFYKSPRLEQTSKVYEPFFEGALGSHWFLGLGLDVCTLKPEILTVLIINRRALLELVPEIPMNNLEGRYLYKPFNPKALEAYAHSNDAGREGVNTMLAAGSAAIARVLDPAIWPAISAEVDRVRALA